VLAAFLLNYFQHRKAELTELARNITSLYVLAVQTLSVEHEEWLSVLSTEGTQMCGLILVLCFAIDARAMRSEFLVLIYGLLAYFFCWT
jgi:hypothetical protein